MINGDWEEHNWPRLPKQAQLAVERVKSGCLSVLCLPYTLHFRGFVLPALHFSAVVY
jgi:hypothetical protein